nr:hypothetical protein [Pseudomonas sp. BIGb0427]
MPLITEDRKGEGLLLSQSISANIALGNLPAISRAGIVNSGAERELAERQIAAMRIRSSSPEQVVGELSGGNQQKVVIGRWLERDCSVCCSMSRPAASTSAPSSTSMACWPSLRARARRWWWCPVICAS